MPTLPSFISYGRRTKAAIKSPFSLLRGEASTSSAPSAPTFPVNFANSEVIDINDKSARYSESLDFDGGKPIDEYEKDLVDQDPTYTRPDTTPQVQLDIDSPEALTDWFAANLFQRGSFGLPPERTRESFRSAASTSKVGSRKNGTSEGTSLSGDDGNSEQGIGKLEAMNPSNSGKFSEYDHFNLSDYGSSKNLFSNTISIPTASQDDHRPRSADYKSSRRYSVIGSPASSAVSGTTLARALMSNTFVLSNDNRASRYRSGVFGLTRSDSTTLPSSEHSYEFDYDERFEISPNAPALPWNAEFLYEPPKKPRNPEWKEKRRLNLKRRSSTGSLSTKTLADSLYTVSTRPNSVLFSPGVEFGKNTIPPTSPQSLKSPSLPRSPLPPIPKPLYSAGADRTSFTQESRPQTYQEAAQQFPLDSQLLSPDIDLISPSLSEYSARNYEDVLNYYSLPDSPQPLSAINYRPAFSPISEESISQLSPPVLASRNDDRDSQLRSLPIGTRSPLAGSIRVRGETHPLPRIPPDSRFARHPPLFPAGARPLSTTQIPSPSSPQSMSSLVSASSDLVPPPVSTIFNRQRSGSAPSPIMVVRDSRNVAAYNITITPHDLGLPTTEEGEVTVSQEFPETPNAFSPLITTGTNGSPMMMPNLDGLEITPMPTVPLSATFPSKGSSQPSLAQQLLLTRAGTTVRHSRQPSLGKVKPVGARSGSPSSRRLVDITEHSAGSPILKPESPLVEAGVTSTHSGSFSITEDVLSNSSEWNSAPAADSGSINLVSAVNISRASSGRISVTQTSDSSGSIYVSSPESRGTRMKSLPAIPVSPTPSTPASIHSATSPPPTSLPEPPTAPAAVPNVLYNIPPPPLIPAPVPPLSPTLSQNHKTIHARGRLPPALTIAHSNVSGADRTVAVNEVDSAGSPSGTFAPQELEIPGPTTIPAPMTHMVTAPHQSNLPYRHEDFSTRSSDIFRGTSLGSPPPYYSVFKEEHTHSPGISQAQSQQTNSVSYGAHTPAMSVPSTSAGEWTNSGEYRTPLNRENSSISQRARMRPPLPAGPRRPSQGFPALQRDRSGSVSSITSNNPLLQASRRRPDTIPEPSPKFQTPNPKWRGYTMEAAKWTFTSSQLQAIVSRAIRQSAEASAIRLLRLEVLDDEVPDEIKRLEAQRRDVKTRYKSFTRRRTNLFDSLTSYLSGEEEESSIHVLRLVEDLRETSVTLDKLSEELHSLDTQLAYLDSLIQTHTSSALAMALRKLNSSFLKSISENQALQTQIQSLEAERDEAWQEAEFVANEYDRMNDGVSSKRSSRVSAVRKSSIRVSKAGLRTPSHRLSQISSHGIASSSARSPMLRVERMIPPVPPIPSPSIPRPRPFNILTDSPLRSSLLSPNAVTPTSENRALAQAQDELYAMLGLSNPERTLRKSHSFSLFPEPPPSGISGQTPLLSPNYPGTANSWRRSSLPGDSALAETYNAMAADRNAILATLDMLSATD